MWKPQLVSSITSSVSGRRKRETLHTVSWNNSDLSWLCKYFGIFQSETANERSECYRRISDHQLFLIIYSGIHEKGLKGYIHSYVEPMPMMAAINILELFTRPLSLCMRLFGNVLGAFVLMELITHIAPAIVPLPFSCYFDFFDGLLQAYVFVLLTSLFISESMSKMYHDRYTNLIFI